ncbi:MAG: cation diffusion facilitator family transporter [Rudaea sp.]|uniref:cation diffusion facilitator family transporter n=1 Tax=Rudaea sp. TaxID=2136325 RepID=UPI0039E53086
MSAPEHHHDHDHAGAGERRLLWAFVLTSLTLVVEAFGGWFSGSLALLADAGHMFVDAFALLLAWMGAYFARRPADDKRSFGYARLEVLVGYTNALGQFVLVAWIVAEAVARFAQPAPILSGVMLAIAIAGLAVNLFVLRVLGGHDHDDLNAAGARLHVLGDLLGSLGAVAAALLIRWRGWLWADPAFSILVSLLIVNSAWRLLKRSAHILLEGTPEGVDVTQVTVAAREGEGIVDVHHVHVWQLAGGRRLATLHARLAEEADAQAALAQVQRVLRERFRIAHATVQIERRDCAHEDCGRHAHDDPDHAHDSMHAH